MAGLEVFFRRWFAEFIPGADQLAVVTTEHAVAHFGAQFFRNAALQLYGEVADAFTGIEFVRAFKGICGADVLARGAAATMFLFKNAGSLKVPFQVPFQVHSVQLPNRHKVVVFLEHFLFLTTLEQYLPTYYALN